MGIHNIQCWKNSAVGLVGLLLDDSELVADATLRPVRVETNNAVVTLNGTVASEAAHVRALELARSTSGVSRIEDNIKVLASGEASTNR